MRTGIALGSNVGDRLNSLSRARRSVLAIPSVAEPVLSSSLYETEPVDAPPGSGNFLNAVLEVEYQGDPAVLLKALQQIEEAMGRPSVRALNSPRVVDLDILYCGENQTSDPILTIPHPRMHLRRFVLLPLAEIRPELCLPGMSANIQELLARVVDPTEAKRAFQQWELH